MPKDATKQSHRGIGFVTFANADSVEAVMSSPHSMNGQELAIDRATPKDKVRPMLGLCIHLCSPHRIVNSSKCTSIKGKGMFPMSKVSA